MCKLAAVALGAALALCGQPQDTPPGVYRVGGGVTPPRVTFKRDPEYSEEARKVKASGAVLLRVVVSPDGKPTDMSVVRAFGYGLDEKALEAVSAWTFQPGMKEGKPVAVLANIEVNFRLLDKKGWHPGALVFRLPAGVSRPVVIQSVGPDEAIYAGPADAVVELELDIAENGATENVRVVKSAGPEIDAAVNNAVGQWRFEPALKDGNPVKVSGRLQYVHGNPITSGAAATARSMGAGKLTSPEDAYRAGIDLMGKRNYGDAIVYFNRAIELKKDWDLPYSERGAANYELKQYAKAIADFDEAIRIRPDAAAAYNRRGLAYFASGQPQRAIDDYDRAIRLDSRTGANFANRGRAYSEIGRQDLALKDLNEAIRLDPNDTKAYYNRAEAYFRMKDYAHAIQDCDQLLGMQPGSTAAYRLRGDAKKANGDKSGAQSDYKRAKELEAGAAR